jgi:hypothetical protein
MKLALKIDVDTWRGTLQGVPRLVEILRRGTGPTPASSSRSGPTTPDAPSRAPSAPVS